MVFSKGKQIFFLILSASAYLTALIGGVALGLGLSETRNIEQWDNFGDYQPDLPTQVLDINGELITQFFAEEKRDIITYTSIPRHLVNALLVREDRDFFHHNGFSVRGTVRAAWQIITGQLFSGGSTLTQQLAGHLYSDRTNISIFRKLEELWWAFQMERSLTKYEILEQYLNKMPFGHGTYGIEAASQFYFSKPVTESSLAESVLLVIQLVRPGLYSPLRNPSSARVIQETVMDQMVAENIVSQETVVASLDEYWSNYNWNRAGAETAFLDFREDNAPYFSEYIRRQLDSQLLGAMDIYRDGFVVHTTLNLEHQAVADRVMANGLDMTNARYEQNIQSRLDVMDAEVIPLLDLLALAFNLEDIRVTGIQNQRQAQTEFREELHAHLDLLSMVFGIDELKDMARAVTTQQETRTRRNSVEGALIALENSTGYITAMVGGSGFERGNQLNRSFQALVQPGSSFKPLYYSAALDTRQFTLATRLYDGPVVFYDNYGEPYAPSNYGGRWQGGIRLRHALAQSLNIPSLYILDSIGFDAAIDRSATLLGISDPLEIERNFPRVYPLGLGISSVTPMQMARAFAIFGNQGRDVQPIAIRYIEDRNGNVIANPAAEQLNEQRRRGRDNQIISPQNAFLMSKMMESTLTVGTLRGNVNRVGGMPMPMAGKTGTPQNWSDAWSIGYSVYYTTAVWFGFDQPGNSLGLNNVGAAGDPWAQFMKEIHQDLSPADFPRPSGIVEVTVDARSGLLPSGHPNEVVISEYFMEGTAPTRISDYYSYIDERNNRVISNWENNFSLERINQTLDLELDLDLNIDSGSSTTAPLIPNLDLNFEWSPTDEEIDPYTEEEYFNPLLD